MTQEQKELLLKDICSRLPYGVKLQHVKNTDSIVELYSIDLDDFYCKIQFYTYKGKALTASDEGKLLKPGGMLRYKPLLFPLSSMTEGQYKEWCDLEGEPLDEILTRNAKGEIMSTLEHHLLIAKSSTEPVNYCYKNHFDINGLIPKGLANDATGLNIY